jgi:hypothetical protein
MAGVDRSAAHCAGRCDMFLPTIKLHFDRHSKFGTTYYENVFEEIWHNPKPRPFMIYKKDYCNLAISAISVENS